MFNCAPPSDVGSGSVTAAAVEAFGFCQNAETMLPGASGVLAAKLAPFVNVGATMDAPLTCPAMDALAVKLPTSAVTVKLPTSAVTVTLICAAAEEGYQEAS